MSFAHSWEILSALEDKIRIPAQPWNILYIFEFQTSYPFSSFLFSLWSLFFLFPLISGLNLKTIKGSYEPTREYKTAFRPSPPLFCAFCSTDGSQKNALQNLPHVCRILNIVWLFNFVVLASCLPSKINHPFRLQTIKAGTKFRAYQAWNSRPNVSFTPGADYAKSNKTRAQCNRTRHISVQTQKGTERKALHKPDVCKAKYT